MNTIAQKAQIARINRKLAKRDEKLLTSRGWRELQNLGTYHIVNVYRNEVVNSHINLDDLEAELIGENSRAA